MDEEEDLNTAPRENIDVSSPAVSDRKATKDLLVWLVSCQQQELHELEKEILLSKEPTVPDDALSKIQELKQNLATLSSLLYEARHFHSYVGRVLALSTRKSTPEKQALSWALISVVEDRETENEVYPLYVSTSQLYFVVRLNFILSSSFLWTVRLLPQSNSVHQNEFLELQRSTVAKRSSNTAGPLGSLAAT